MDQYFKEHLQDLSERADRSGRFTFTDFLNAEEQNELYSIRNSLHKFELFGGTENCDRVICRFGDEDELFYSEEFPIDCVKCEPVNKKFADQLSHRDVLGALMNLGLNRNKIGDIFIKENCVYMFVNSSVSDFITDNLFRIKHTDIKTDIIKKVPYDLLYTFKDKQIIVSSDRIDCIIAGVYNFSRTKASELIKAQKVFINGKTIYGNSDSVKPEDRISVRGFGKFIYVGELKQTKKNRNVIEIKLFV